MNFVEETSAWTSISSKLARTFVCLENITQTAAIEIGKIRLPMRTLGGQAMFVFLEYAGARRSFRKRANAAFREPRSKA